MQPQGDNENCQAVWSVLEKNTEANLKVGDGAAEQHRPASQSQSACRDTPVLRTLSQEA